MSSLILPKGYKNLLGKLETECAISKIKRDFQNNLAFELNLQRASAPLFVMAGTGLNDDLNGVERPVQFPVRALNDAPAQVVQSLAKWKRMELAHLEIGPGDGIYTDMNAIRADEDLDNLHSLYVDQWDWEKVITAQDRNLETLKNAVRHIYYALRRTERFICNEYPVITPFLPESITFLHTEDLEAEFPTLTPKEREDAVARKYGAVFLIGIGANLPLSGKPHDGRAPDYDDWSTPTDERHRGLNGDILVYDPLLNHSFELSSMGIRVDKTSLACQLKERNAEQRLSLKFHAMLMNGELPLTMGGGIGQSRLCMLLLHKAHIGEVQASIWPEEMISACKKAGIFLL